MRNQLRALGAYLLCVLVVFLPACQGEGFLSPAQERAALADIDRQEAEGIITPEQADDMRAIIRLDGVRDRYRKPDGSFDEELLWSVASIAGALFGVRIWRGGVNNRKGSGPAQ